jgi:UDP-N-acetylmuramate dehydrogenase
MNMAEPKTFMQLRGTLKRDEPMARHVSWRAGGKAERLYMPADIEDLANFLKTLPFGELLLFVGLGSNLLVRNGGFRGTVVLMHSAGLRPETRNGRVYAQGGVAAPKVARYAALHALQGAEFLAGIPGTVGGALAMNAGCYGAETWDIVETVQTINRAGETFVRRPREFEIGYRHCKPAALREEWFVGASFTLEPGDGEASRAKIKELLARRIATQPLSLPNAGSVFRNPPDDHAARLIEECGLKGLSRGGARVSEKHANFIVNPEGLALASDIELLIQEVQRRVFEKKGVKLIPEVQIVGEAK